MDHLHERLDALEHHVQTLHHQSRTVTRQLRWWRATALLLLVLGLVSLPWQVAHTQEGGAAQTQEDAVEDTFSPMVAPQDAGTVSGVCGTSFGTRFNLEPRPNARPQNTTSIDLLRNRVAAGVDLVVGGATDYRDFNQSTFYYVSRDADCAPEFEGRLPPLPDPFESGDLLFGQGSPVIAADPARDAVFLADERRDDGIPLGIGLFRTTAARLLNQTACPNGTHTEAQAATCWPTKRLILETPFQFPGAPHLAVDERTSGTGAGNVYVVAKGNLSDESVIFLVACTNTLSTCSAPLIIDVSLAAPRNPHVAVRPDGRITVTWFIVDDDSGEEWDGGINYRSCTPTGAPSPLACGPVSGVHGGPHMFFFPGKGGKLATQDFGIVTHPQHAHRLDANGIETYVVWEQCKVPLSLSNVICPDADVMMKASNNDGATWSALTCVSCAAQDQFFPAITTDRSRNILNIAFYNSGNDATFQHRVQVFLRHINPGGATPDPSDAHPLTTLLNDPSADPMLGGTDFGRYIGVAARGTGVDGQSRAYVHYTYNNIQGTLSGVQVPEQNNHLSRLDY